MISPPYQLCRELDLVCIDFCYWLFRGIQHFDRGFHWPKLTLYGCQPAADMRGKEGIKSRSRSGAMEAPTAKDEKGKLITCSGLVLSSARAHCATFLPLQALTRVVYISSRI